MPGFIYWIPNRTTIGVEELAQGELGYAFANETGITIVKLTAGPGGQGGILVALEASVPTAKVLYKPDEQEWRAIPASKLEAQCGMYTTDADLPGPDVLLRRKLLQGHVTELGDGKDWLVPIARRFIEEDDELRWMCALPKRQDIDADGEWVDRGVVPRYRQLWKVAETFWTVRCAATAAAAENDEGPKKVQFDFPDQLDACVTVLRENYRLSRIEVAMLGLLDDETTGRILEAVTDVPTMHEFNKKKIEAAIRAQDSAPT